MLSIKFIAQYILQIIIAYVIIIALHSDLYHSVKLQSTTSYNIDVQFITIIHNHTSYRVESIRVGNVHKKPSSKHLHKCSSFQQNVYYGHMQ